MIFVLLLSFSLLLLLLLYVKSIIIKSLYLASTQPAIIKFITNMALEMAVAYQAAPVVATQAASAMAAVSAYMGTLAAESALVATTSTVATVGTTTLLSTVLLPVTATVVGISVVGLAAKYFMSSATETEAKSDTKEKKKDKDNPEIHQAWSNLSSYRGKTKKGVTSKNNVYYYEKDYTHGDVEVYQKFGSKGLHVGSVSMQGGQLTKPAVPGRTINL